MDSSKRLVFKEVKTSRNLLAGLECCRGERLQRQGTVTYSDESSQFFELIRRA